MTRATSEEKSSSFRSSSLVMSSNSEHARWILKSRIRQTPRHDEIYLSNETLLLCRNIHSFLIVRHRDVSPKPTMSLSERVTIRFMDIILASLNIDVATFTRHVSH